MLRYCSQTASLRPLSWYNWIIITLLREQFETIVLWLLIVCRSPLYDFEQMLLEFWKNNFELSLETGSTFHGILSHRSDRISATIDLKCRFLLYIICIWPCSLSLHFHLSLSVIHIFVGDKMFNWRQKLML